jgi:hypothetical protein
MVLEVAPSIDQGGGAGSKPSKLYRELLSAAHNLDISVIHEAVVPPNCLDREAASIIPKGLLGLWISSSGRQALAPLPQHET